MKIKLLPLFLLLIFSACTAEIPAEPAETTAEEILLEKAQQFHDLMRDYLNTDDDLLVFDLGHDGCDQIYLNVISDTLTDYQSVKDIFTEVLSDDYADYMLRDRPDFPVFMEKNDVLYFAPSESAIIGTLDTWCVGYEETEDKIVGRFAMLSGVPGHPEGEPDEEYLNDLKNYWFYNITLEKFPEGYRITDCRVTDQELKYPAHDEHTFYHSGAADLSKITNPELIPIDIPEKENTLNEISADTDFELNEIFTEHAEILTDYDINDFPVRSEQAISSLVDTLFETKKFREDMNWIFTEMATLNEEAYYQISICSSNDMFSNIGTFWVNADSGAIYLKYDPTLDNKGYFSEFVDNIPENDGRTRLIAFP